MLMVFTATPYDAYNWRYCQNEMLIWRWVNISETKRDTTRVPLAKMFISTYCTKNHRKHEGGREGAFGGIACFFSNKSSVFVPRTLNQFSCLYRLPQIMHYKAEIRQPPRAAPYQNLSKIVHCRHSRHPKYSWFGPSYNTLYRFHLSGVLWRRRRVGPSRAVN